MAKPEKILDENLVKPKKKEPPKTSVASDLGSILIGMLVMIAFIAVLVFGIGSLIQ